MDFLIACDTAGRVIFARGQVRHEMGRFFGLSGVGPGALDGLAAAYSARGRDLSGSWIGQYSAAVAEEARLILAQSSLGLGRAYWHRGPGGIVVGSDLLAVARRANSVALDPVYFARFLALRPVLDRTPFAQVRQLFGGATAVFTANGIVFSHPWQPRDGRAEHHPVDRLERLLEEAVEALLPEEKPVVAEISGGTDSSLVAAMAHRSGRRITGICHVADRGMHGRDRDCASLVASRLKVPLREFDADRHGLSTTLVDFPDQPGNCRYRDSALAVAAHIHEVGAVRLATGVGGDIVFDYRGLVPAFLADGLVGLRLREAWGRAADYAAERGGHRGAAHYLRYVGLPVATAHLRRRNLGEPIDAVYPDWLASDLVTRATTRARPRALSVRRPSARYLWEALFVLTAGENFAHPLEPETEVVHPLLHRPLVEFLLGLPSDQRRGRTGDRALQRALLGRLGLTEIAARQDKGSSQQLRELHLAEAGALLESLEKGQLVSRGWVEPTSWQRAIDRASVGADPHAAFFGAAVEAELWLRRAASVDWGTGSL